MQQLTEETFVGSKVFPNSFKTFQCNTDHMNSGKLYDIPKGALIGTELTSISELAPDTEINKYGYVIFRNNYIHTDIIRYNSGQNIALCCNRDSKETFHVDLKDVEVLKVVNLCF